MDLKSLTTSKDDIDKMSKFYSTKKPNETVKDLSNIPTSLQKIYLMDSIAKNNSNFVETLKPIIATDYINLYKKSNRETQKLLDSVKTTWIPHFGQGYVKTLDRNNPDIEKLKLEIENVISETTIPTTPYLEDIPSDFDYDSSLKNTEPTTVHIGQRKLFNALLFFLTKYATDDDIVLYLGSSPGFNIPGVMKLFPNLDWILYDPNTTFVKENFTGKSKVEIMKKKIDRNTVQFDQLKILNGSNLKSVSKKILLFSDIRSSDDKNKESDVILDMVLQKDIVKNLEPKAWCLKFRLPFHDFKGKRISEYEYLDGFLSLQPWAPRNSTEVRLMSNKFSSKRYSLKIHENKMFYINKILREWGKYDNVPIQGGDNCYECHLEELICKVYLDKNSKIYKDLKDLREYISLSNPKLDIRHIAKYSVDSCSTNKCHGNFPILNRNIDNYLDVIDPVSFVTDLLLTRVGLRFSFGELYSLLEKYRTRIIEAFTHKSMSDENYEYFEFIGDRVLNNTISTYLARNFENTSVSLLHEYFIIFSKGTTATEIFAKQLKLSRVLKISDELDIQKPLEDVFESFLGVLSFIFDSEYSVGVGFTIAYKIVESILVGINFDNFAEDVFPKKTQLKEIFDAKYKGWKWNDLFVTTIDEKHHKIAEKLYDPDNELSKIKVEIFIPNDDGSKQLLVKREEENLKPIVEREAAMEALERLNEMGIYSKMNIKDNRLTSRQKL